MNILCSNGMMSINIGGSDTWMALCSTITVNLKKEKNKIPKALAFLQNGACSSQECLETAHQFNLIRDMLSDYPPQKLVYNAENPKLAPPWGTNISPTITSCANYLVSGDGYDLLAEIVRILTYAYYTKSNVNIG